MSWVIDHPDGALVEVRAQPGARQDSVRGVQGGALRLAVTAAPEKGKANRAIVELFCEALQIKRSAVEVVAGATSRQKRLLVRGLSAEELRRRVASLSSP